MGCSLPMGLLCPWDSPGQKSAVGCQALLQRIFPMRGSNPSLALAGRFFTVVPPRKPGNSPYSVHILMSVPVLNCTLSMKTEI